MASYANGELLDLDGPSSSPISPTATTFGSTGKSMATASRPSTTQSDSFAGLADLVRAKKPWTPIPPPTPKPSLSAAPNGIQFAKRVVSASSILNPTAQPFARPQSVAAFMQDYEQERVTSKPPIGVSNNLQARFDLLDRELSDLHIDEPSEQRRAASPSLSPPAALLPGFITPPHIGPIAPPTPAESTQHHHVSAYDRSNVPVVRLTKDVWESITNELKTLSKEKRELQQRLASVERDQQALPDEDHDVGQQIGKLRYQNEANRDQKAAMGRALTEKNVRIKEQELDIVNLGKKISELEAEIQRRGKLIGESEWLRTAIKDNETAHALDLEAKDIAMQHLQERIDQLVIELEESKQAQRHVGDYAARAQNLSDDVLAQKQKTIMDLRYELVQEKDHAMALEDEVERLRKQVNQASLDSVKAELHKKSIQCDRFRTQLKTVQQRFDVCQAQLNKAHNGGEALRGGAHLVTPHERSKLPRNIISCAECYGRNIPCDNGAICRNCALNNVSCGRWRCSLKHKLGECPDHPCKLPHDPQGWLVTLEARPEW